MRNLLPAYLNNRKSLTNNESGAVAIIAALCIIVFLAVAALAVDVGHIYVVRNELQNAADAAALAGVGKLYPNTPSYTIPNWADAETAASATVKKNQSDGTLLVDSTVTSGYYYYGLQPNLKAKSITPGPDDIPAIKVTVSRSAGKNGGPVPMFLASIMGINSGEVSATAIAVSGSPGSVNPGGLFPVAITQDMVNQYKDSDPPVTFQIGSSYHYPTNEAGQWTSFQTDANDVPTISDLIANGNPTELNVGDQIWIEPGTKTSIYKDVPSNIDVLLPVVANINTHAEVQIVEFIGFHIDFASGGSDKYIQGHFITNFEANQGNPGGGPNYGAYTPPKLVTES